MLAAHIRMHQGNTRTFSALLVREGSVAGLFWLWSKYPFFETMATRLGCGTKAPGDPCLLEQMDGPVCLVQGCVVGEHPLAHSTPRPPPLSPSHPPTLGAFFTVYVPKRGGVASRRPGALAENGKPTHLFHVSGEGPASSSGTTAGRLRLCFRCMALSAVAENVRSIGPKAGERRERHSAPDPSDRCDWERG
jgi:hypothetical protein